MISFSTILKKSAALLVLMGLMASFLPASQAAVSINEEYRPTYAPQGYSEIYEENTDDPSKNFSDTSVNYIIADLAVVLLQLAGILTIYFIISNGFAYVRSFGRDEEIQKAKKGLTWAIVGLIVVLTSYAIVQNIFKITLSVDPESGSAPTTQSQSTTPSTAPTTTP
ncbi:MAG: hypothetical protein ACD_28C00005G0010 [uncultured bacterium]|nr:MAG: hypothetical protein ACD_28C00005G0010 [uncultured bacterium]